MKPSTLTIPAALTFTKFLTFFIINENMQTCHDLSHVLKVKYELNQRIKLTKQWIKNTFFAMFSHKHSWFDAHHAGGIVLQVDGQSCLHSAPSWNHRFGLQHPFYHTQRIMQRALHLITHEVVCSTQDYRCWCASLCTKHTKRVQ